jgi:hypothetical protein
MLCCYVNVSNPLSSRKSCDLIALLLLIKDDLQGVFSLTLSLSSIHATKFNFIALQKTQDVTKSSYMRLRLIAQGWP